MIIGEIRRYLRDNNSIRVSRSMRDLAYKALSIREELTRKSGKEPTLAEIAQRLNSQSEQPDDTTPPREYSEAEIGDALEAIIEPISLYEPLFSDASGDSVCVMDQICDVNCGDEHWLEDIALGQALAKLSERERAIINLRFYKGKTQMEIADEIGISLNEMLCRDYRSQAQEKYDYALEISFNRPNGKRGDYIFTYHVSAEIFTAMIF